MSDFTLYKVSQDFENLIDLIERDVLEDWEIADLKARLAGVINAQSTDIIKWYVSELADIESLKSEIERLKVIKSSKEARIETFKTRLSDNMRTLKVKKISTPLGNITLALDSMDTKVELKEGANVENIPEKYLRIKKELNKTEAKKALINGENIEGVEIIETPSRVRFMLGQASKDHIAEAGE